MGWNMHDRYFLTTRIMNNRVYATCVYVQELADVRESSSGTFYFGAGTFSTVKYENNEIELVEVEGAEVFHDTCSYGA